MNTQQTKTMNASLSSQQLNNMLNSGRLSLISQSAAKPESSAEKVLPKKSLDALLAQWTTQEIYRIDADVESPLDALFYDEHRPWAIFWIPPQEGGKQSDQARIFGHLIWAQLDSEAFIHTQRLGLNIHDNGATVEFQAAEDQAYKKQQARLCETLITGHALQTMSFSELLCQLYNLARLHQENPINFLLLAMFDQTCGHHRYQESLFSILEYELAPCEDTECRELVIQQMIGKTLALMLFKAFHRDGKVQAAADINRLREGIRVLNSHRELLTYNPLFSLLPEFQKIDRRLKRLMRDWHL